MDFNYRIKEYLFHQDKDVPVIYFSISVILQLSPKISHTSRAWLTSSTETAKYKNYSSCKPLLHDNSVLIAYTTVYYFLVQMNDIC